MLPNKFGFSHAVRKLIVPAVFLFSIRSLGIAKK